MDTPRRSSGWRRGERVARYAAAAVSALVLVLAVPVLIEAEITQFTKGQVTLTLAGAQSTLQLKSGSFNDYAGGPWPAGSGDVNLTFCSNEKCSGPDNLTVEMEIIKTGSDPYVETVRVRGPGTDIAYLRERKCPLRVVRFSQKGVEGSCTARDRTRAETLRADHCRN